MKRSLFGLLGVKTGGGEWGWGIGGLEGGQEGVFHGHPVKREKHGWSSITASIRKVSVSGWSAGGCRRSEKQWTILHQTSPSRSYHCILVSFAFPSWWGGGINSHGGSKPLTLSALLGLELEEKFSHFIHFPELHFIHDERPSLTFCAGRRGKYVVERLFKAMWAGWSSTIPYLHLQMLKPLFLSGQVS